MHIYWTDVDSVKISPKQLFYLKIKKINAIRFFSHSSKSINTSSVFKKNQYKSSKGFGIA